MFRAYDQERDRLVAIKLFRVDLPPERVHQLVAAFETIVAAQLAHPALVAPIATGISGNSPYLVEDFIVAESLDTAVREYGAAPAADALRVAAQLGGALDFAAVVHIDHGALHPRDILLSSDATKLTGIGVARALERVGVAVPIRRPYTAPERTSGQPWDRRADVFSLAALVHELLWARRVSGTGAAAAQSLPAITGADLARLRAVFARALADDPEDRFQTALAFVNALNDAFATAGAVAEPLPTEIAAAPPKEAAAAKLTEPPVPLVVASEPDDLELRREEEERFAEVEAGPTLGTPLGLGQPAAGSFDTAARDARAAADVFATPPEAAPTPLPQPSRSGIMPIAFALLIGAAIGFAGGYGVGSRDRLDESVEVEAPHATPAAAPAAPAPAEATSGNQVAPPPVVAEASPPPAETTRQPDLPVAPKPEPPRHDEPAISGRLLVRTTPSGARVTVDGRDYGRTPVTVRGLHAGAHRVEVSRDGYVSDERRITVTAAQPSHSVTMRLERARSRASVTRQPAPPTPSTPSSVGRFSAPLLVDSRPAGAKVVLDGRVIGTTPLSVSEVRAGEHMLRIEREGYRAWSSTVRVIAEQQNRVTASLER